MKDKLYRQLMKHKFHLVNVKCSATISWYARLVMEAVKLMKDEKVKFT